MKIVSISAGLSNPSNSTLLLKMISSKFKEKNPDDLIIENYELKEYSIPIMNNLTNGFANPALQALIDSVESADVIVFSSPIYKASISGLLKSFLDILDENILEGKPVILGATGGSMRHSATIDYAIRPIFNYMRANVVPTSLYVSPDEWGDMKLLQRVGQAIDEALHAARAESLSSRKDKTLEFSDFSQMLNQLNN